MIYVSSDWHGYPLDKIKALLADAGFSKNDFLFVLGDVIDRGDDGVRILKWLMLQDNIELILGNHEAMMLSNSWLFDEVTNDSLDALDSKKLSLLTHWQANGCEPTLNALKRESAETRADILDYLRDAPLYDSVSVDKRDFLLVHGGLGNYSESKRMSDYTPHELLWTRPELSTQYSDSFTTVFGHTPTVTYSESYSGRMLDNGSWINIDTGVSCGLAPMLLRLDDMKEFYLPLS